MIALALIYICPSSTEKQQNLSFWLGLEIRLCCCFLQFTFLKSQNSKDSLSTISFIFLPSFSQNTGSFSLVLSVNYLSYLISKFCPVLLNQFPLLLLNEKGFLLDPLSHSHMGMSCESAFILAVVFLVFLCRLEKFKLSKYQRNLVINA